MIPMMDRHMREALDRHITGNWGEDSVPDDELDEGDVPEPTRLDWEYRRRELNDRRAEADEPIAFCVECGDEMTATTVPTGVRLEHVNGRTDHTPRLWVVKDGEPVVAQPQRGAMTDCAAREPERPEPAAAQRMLADFQRTYDGYRAGREDGLSEGRREGLADLAVQLREWAGNGVHEWHAALRHAARWAEQLADGGQLVAPQRCAAAHPQDRTPCEGPLDAVQVVDQGEASVSGCVRHSAVLLATLTGGRVYPGSVQGAAIAVYERAQGLAPYGFGAAGDPA